MATGGFKSNATTDFLEEWKAKREKMRAKMLGDIAAATGAPLAAGRETLTNNGGPAGNCLPPTPVPRSSSGTAPKRAEEEPQHTAASSLNKTPTPPPPQCVSPDSSPAAAADSDKETPSPGKGKEKKSAGPSARKGKGQIEKRKLREKRRSTGVVNMPSNESLDELDDDDGGRKDRREEEELVQANTFQNETMMADPVIGHVVETQRSGGLLHKSCAGPGSEEEAGGSSRKRHGRHGRDGGATAPGGPEKRLEEMEKELAKERQENARLLKIQQDKDDIIGKLKEEIDLLNRDLDDIEDENEQLKQENKTLLKVVGQLTR
ncbi:PRKC apoptosis WT1 regulator protein [Thalassophryne amazonica]|uniref:PRKC apoptosis WT1 regulator protein n=1 Tax=Thalassophryne amazonica TaxID=390379 RepID=UPI0014717C7E|nr:PRKC apoptosis WT1 regulator protein [Thalassophryne amazonica]